MDKRDTDYKVDKNDKIINKALSAAIKHNEGLQVHSKKMDVPIHVLNSLYPKVHRQVSTVSESHFNINVKDMPVDEMKQFYHQTLVAMADTFERATNDDKMSATMRDFCDYFAEKLDLKK